MAYASPETATVADLATCSPRGAVSRAPGPRMPLLGGTILAGILRLRGGGILHSLRLRALHLLHRRATVTVELPDAA